MHLGLLIVYHVDTYTAILYVHLVYIIMVTTSHGQKCADTEVDISGYYDDGRKYCKL